MLHRSGEHCKDTSSICIQLIITTVPDVFKAPKKKTHGFDDRATDKLVSHGFQHNHSFEMFLWCRLCYVGKVILLESGGIEKWTQCGHVQTFYQIRRVGWPPCILRWWKTRCFPGLSTLLSLTPFRCLGSQPSWHQGHLCSRLCELCFLGLTKGVHRPLLGCS